MKTKLLYCGLPLLVADTTLITTTLCAQDVPTGRDQPAEPKLALETRDSAASGEDPWQFSVIPLLWLSGVNGNVTVK